MSGPGPDDDNGGPDQGPEDPVSSDSEETASGTGSEESAAGGSQQTAPSAGDDEAQSESTPTAASIDGASDSETSGRSHTETEANSPPPTVGSGTERVTIEDDGIVRWFLRTDDGTVTAVRDVLSSVAVVALIGLILFGVSGIWPPLVAVESGSMEPNMERGDLIFIADDDRFVGDDPAAGTGIVTADTGEQNGYDRLGEYGDVIIFAPNGNEFQTPIIHRAHFWVEDGDDWVEMADPDYLGVDSCDQVQTCPARHDGFITKGDNNAGYDQDQTTEGAPTDVVKPEWVTGKGMFRIPWLGYVRLTFDEIIGGMLIQSPTLPDGVGTGPTSAPVGLVGVASAVAIAGGRRSGHW